MAAALRRIGEQDLDIVHGDRNAEPAERLQFALRRVADGELLDPTFLALRLQLWSLATVDNAFADINRAAQSRHLEQLTNLITAARPELVHHEAARRAGEILVIQNGIWLTAAIINDPDAIERSLERCRAIAFAPAQISGAR